MSRGEIRGTGAGGYARAMMKTAVLIVAPMVVAGALSGCSLTHEDAAATAAMRGRTAPVGVVIDAWHDAAARGDWDTYAAHMTDDIVFLGTDKTERWAGAGFREFAQPYFTGPTAYGQGAWTYKSVERQVSSRGTVAWWDEKLVHERYGNCRGTGVLVRGGDGAWRITHYSLTFPVPNEIAPEVVGQIQAHERAAGEKGTPGTGG
ncbi:MAG: hypothetical protein DHS20C14_20950 [Phycisphaeraceae bacterium]|nr:MAG: hypothetical protein DHS20C14_20950 [Phycisphaeraceae bacterium]